MDTFIKYNQMAPIFCSDEQVNCPLTNMAITFQMSDVVIRARGSKTVRLLTSDGAADDIYSTSNDELCTPLGPANFGKHAPATRMNFEVRLDDADDLSFFDGLVADYLWVPPLRAPQGRLHTPAPHEN